MKQPKRNKKNITLDDLAVMMARGFEDMATKEDLNPLATKKELQEFSEKLENRLDVIEGEIKEIKIVLGPLARTMAVLEVDMQNLQQRVATLERKVGLSKK